MPATIHCQKAIRRDEGWFHPATGDFLTDAEKDHFVLYARNTETGEIVVSFAVDRTALEQHEDGVKKALTIEPVRIRRA